MGRKRKKLDIKVLGLRVLYFKSDDHMFYKHDLTINAGPLKTFFMWSPTLNGKMIKTIYNFKRSYGSFSIKWNNKQISSHNL